MRTYPSLRGRAACGLASIWMFCAFAGALCAHTWTGASDSDYANTANWLPTAPPLSNPDGEPVVFPDVANQAVTLPGEVRVNEVRFDAPDAYSVLGSGRFRYVDLNVVGSGALSFGPNVEVERDGFEGGRLGGPGTGIVTAAGGLRGDAFQKTGPWTLEVTAPSPNFDTASGTYNNNLGNTNDTLNVFEGAMVLSGNATFPQQTRIQVGNGFGLSQAGAGGFTGPLAMPIRTEAAFVLDNTITANSNRLTDDTILRPRGGGTFRLIGNSATDVVEDLGLLQVGGDNASGTIEVLSLSPSRQTHLRFDALNDGLGGTSSSKRMLIFKAPGATLGASTVGGPRILFDTEPNESAFDSGSTETFIQNETSNGNFAHPAVLVDANGAHWAMYDETVLGGAPRGVRAFDGYLHYTDPTLTTAVNNLDLQVEGDLAIPNNAGAFPQPRTVRFVSAVGGQTVSLSGSNPGFGVLDGFIKDGAGDLLLEGPANTTYSTSTGSTFYFGGGTTTFRGGTLQFSQTSVGGPGQWVIEADLDSSGFSTFLLDGESGNTTDDVVVTGSLQSNLSLSGDGRFAFRGSAFNDNAGAIDVGPATLVLARSSQAAQNRALGPHATDPFSLGGGALEAQGFAPVIDLLAGISLVDTPGGGASLLRGEPFTFRLGADVTTPTGSQNGVESGLFLETNLTLETMTGATVALRPANGGNSQPNAVSRFHVNGPGDWNVAIPIADTANHHKQGLVLGGSGTYTFSGTSTFSGELIVDGGGTVVWNKAHDGDGTPNPKPGPGYLEVAAGSTWMGNGSFDSAGTWRDNGNNNQPIRFAFTSGAVLSPGLSVGTFTFGQPDGDNATLTMDASTTLLIEGDASGFDKVVVYGDVHLDGVTVRLVDLGGARLDTLDLLEVIDGELTGTLNLVTDSPSLEGATVTIDTASDALRLRPEGFTGGATTLLQDNGFSQSDWFQVSGAGNDDSSLQDGSSIRFTRGTALASPAELHGSGVYRYFDDPAAVAPLAVGESLRASVIVRVQGFDNSADEAFAVSFFQPNTTPPPNGDLTGDPAPFSESLSAVSVRLPLGQGATGGGGTFNRSDVSGGMLGDSPLFDAGAGEVAASATWNYAGDEGLLPEGIYTLDILVTRVEDGLQVNAATYGIRALPGGGAQLTFTDNTADISLFSGIALGFTDADLTGPAGLEVISLVVERGGLSPLPLLDPADPEFLVRNTPAQVVNVAPVTPDILAVTVREGRLVRQPQMLYQAEPGDVVNGNLWVQRDGVTIGSLRGPDNDDNGQGDYLLPVTRFVGWRLERDLLQQLSSYTFSDVTGDALPSVTAIYRKSNSEGFANNPAPLAQNVTFVPQVHTLFFKFDAPLPLGGTYQIDFADPGVPTRQFTLDPLHQRSIAVHMNHLGFQPADPSKLGYLSIWTGDGPVYGTVDFDSYVGQGAFTGQFHIINEVTKQPVFTGTMTRLRTPTEIERSFRDVNITGNPGNGWNYPFDGVNFPEALVSGTSDVKLNFSKNYTYALDFSSWGGGTAPTGTYRVYVPGIGTSYPFEIRPQLWLDGFLVSMAGLYHHWSGVAIEEALFGYGHPPAHLPAQGQTVFATTFPFSLTGESPMRGPLSFEEAAEPQWLTSDPVPEAWGGYMDAGDWDRRTQHLDLSWDLLTLYELFPDYFDNVNWGIPSVNETVPHPAYAVAGDLPDLLDEVLFNADLYRRLQILEGGSDPLSADPYYWGACRGGIEHTEVNNTPSWLMESVNFAYHPDANSTYRFAAVAAKIALVFREDYPAISDLYLQQSLKAWSWAEGQFAGDWLTNEWAFIEAALIDQGKSPGEIANEFDKISGRLRGVRAWAATELLRTTGRTEFDQAMLESTNLRTDKAMASFQGGSDLHAAWTLAYTTVESSNPFVKESARRVVDQADPQSGERSFFTAGAGNPQWGNNMNPQSDWLEKLWAHFDLTARGTGTQAERDALLASSVRSVSYVLGANPQNISYTIGLGHDNPMDPLHQDSRFSGTPAPVGITAYGATTPNVKYFFVTGNNGPLDENDPEKAIYPDWDLWPTYESFHNIHLHIITNEYTVQQTITGNGFNWGYLAAFEASGGTLTLPLKEPLPASVVWAAEQSVSSDLSSDSDGDGATDMAEYAAGTDPNDASSKPAVTFGSVLHASKWYPSIAFRARANDPDLTSVAEASLGVNGAWFGPTATTPEGTEEVLPAVPDGSAFSIRTFRTHRPMPPSASHDTADRQFLRRRDTLTLD
ncbi:MAG: glycoside hydrolase family 9 protein [Opitutales bacterium]